MDNQLGFDLKANPIECKETGTDYKEIATIHKQKDINSFAMGAQLERMNTIFV